MNDLTREEQMRIEDIIEHNSQFVNDDPMVYPEGFKVLSSRIFQDKNGKDYKQVHLEDEKGNQHTALAFDSFADYAKVEKDNYVDGYIRQYNSSFTLVDYCKTERTLLDNEKFISPNGEIKQK